VDEVAPEEDVTTQFLEIMKFSGNKDAAWYVEMIAWHHKIKARGKHDDHGTASS